MDGVPDRQPREERATPTRSLPAIVTGGDKPEDAGVDAREGPRAQPDDLPLAMSGLCGQTHPLADLDRPARDKASSGR